MYELWIMSKDGEEFWCGEYRTREEAQNAVYEDDTVELEDGDSYMVLPVKE